MKDYKKNNQKVSLIFYSEEEGKRTMVDKWNIEIGKKYTIGRSKKKVDISIQDITISRMQAEFIFYDKDKIMIKDFDSSNGTYINKERIFPQKERYFSAKDIISVGDEKNELIFEVKEIKNEEKKYIRDDFDEKKENKKNEDNKNYNYFKNEKINKDINKKNRSKSNSKNSSDYNKNYKKDDYDKYDKNDKYDEDKYKNEERYKKDKYEKNEKDDKDDKDDIEKINKYNKKDKYNNYYKYDKRTQYDKDKNNKNKFKKKSRSRSRKNSYEKKHSYSKYHKYSPKEKNRRNRYSSPSNNSWGKSKNEKSKENKNEKENEDDIDKKSKYKNISSYIIKKDSIQEKEIERENDKRQIGLYNEYLKLKREREENNKKSNLPSLLPVLVSRPKDNYSYNDYDEDEEYEEEDEKYKKSYKRRIYSRPPPFRKRIRSIGGYGRSYLGNKRRGGGGYFPPRFRGRKLKKNYY